MRFTVLYVLIPIFVCGQGQDLQTKLNLTIESSIDAGSEHLSAKFINKYVTGGYINTETKNAFFDKLEGLNSAGAILNTEVSLKKFKEADGFLRTYSSVGIEDYSQYDAYFTKDLFGLYFYGNERYKNTNADLSSMDVSQIRFQTIKFGHFRKIGKIGIGLHLGYVMGQSHISIKTNNSKLFTEIDGKYLALSLNANGITSDLDNNKLFSTQGSGFALDFQALYEYRSLSYLKVAINRLGSLHWNDKYKEQYIDTIYNYSGIEIKSILDSFVLDLKSPEELKDELVKSRKVLDRKIQLPHMISIQLRHQFVDNKLWLMSRVGIMDYGRYKTSIQTELNYQLLNFLTIGVDAGIGGYSTWNAGINAGLNLFNRIRLDVKGKSLFNVLDLDRPAAVIGSLRLVIGL